ncbi:MAG: sulfatase-like hydrolase/transferase [Lachnospiraceae bacterium]|nr:sulfatase-like hydrolase/transferase [Lachnospiraceae bacterium]
MPDFKKIGQSLKDNIAKLEWNPPSYYRHMNKQKACELCNQFSLLLHIIACLVGYFVIEALSRHSLGEAWSFLIDRSWVFLYNAFLIFLTTLPVYLLRRRAFYRIFIGAFWILLGVVNCIILAKRVTPFTGPDVKNLSEGLGVFSKYMNGFETAMLVAGLVLLAVVIVIVFFKAPRYRGATHRIISLVMMLVCVALFSGATKIALDKRLLSNYFGNIAFAYEDYGYPYCLSVTLFDTGISSPSGYSESLVKHIVKDSTQDENTDSEDLPNVIFVQLESFFDPTNVRYLNFSEDPIPFFRQLSKDYTSGFYTVPSVGAGTANTEFETLTGMSMRFFGPGEYPYKSVLKEEASESAATVFDSLGYTSHAVHNNEANFYSRRTVYANLGFDTFTSEEFMPEQANTTPLGWMKDEVLTSKITDCLDSTAGSDFVFTVSVQGHGSYPTEPTYPNPEILVTGAETDEQNCEWEYYTNEIHEMDKFIEQLVNALSEKDEKYVLVLYGDHLPTMGLDDSDLTNGNLFQTEYVMWNNFGLEKKDKDTNAYQIMSEVMNQIGIHEGTIFSFHQTQETSEYYQIDLETLQYDLLYGESYAYDGENPYSKKKIQLGIRKTKIDSVQDITEGVYYIKGENFTPSTVVQLNGEEITSAYINSSTLLVQEQDFQEGDWISVAIKSNSSSARILQQENIIVYRHVKDALPSVTAPTTITTYPDGTNSVNPISGMAAEAAKQAADEAQAAAEAQAAQNQ